MKPGKNIYTHSGEHWCRDCGDRAKQYVGLFEVDWYCERCSTKAVVPQTAERVNNFIDKHGAHKYTDDFDDEPDTSPLWPPVDGFFWTAGPGAFYYRFDRAVSNRWRRYAYTADGRRFSKADATKTTKEAETHFHCYRIDESELPWRKAKAIK